MTSEMTLRVIDLARGGAGVCKDAEGHVIFVPFSAPGDLLRVKILKQNKRYAEGEILEILEPALERQLAPCSVFGRCGGCQWQHLPYSLQWMTKIKGVSDLLNKAQLKPFSGVLDEIPATKIWEYRNRIQLRGRGQEMGFFQTRSHELVSVKRCEIARAELNQNLDQVREKGARLGEGYKVELEVGVDGKVRSSWNSPHALDGFRQINDEQNERLKAWVVAGLPSSDILYDLFGGSGNFSIPLLDRMKEIHCVDLSAPLAEQLLRKESLPSHLFFHAASVPLWLKRQAWAAGQKVAIIDPPRGGLGRSLGEIASHLERLEVKELMIIGCDADAWVRDLRGWTQRHWIFNKGLVIDLFPQTVHVECVAHLVRV